MRLMVDGEVEEGPTPTLIVALVPPKPLRSTANPNDLLGGILVGTTDDKTE